MAQLVRIYKCDFRAKPGKFGLMTQGFLTGAQFGSVLHDQLQHCIYIYAKMKILNLRSKNKNREDFRSDF